MQQERHRTTIFGEDPDGVAGGAKEDLFRHSREPSERSPHRFTQIKFGSGELFGFGLVPTSPSRFDPKAYGISVAYTLSYRMSNLFPGFTERCRVL